MGVLLQIWCIFSEHLFLRIPLDGCFCITDERYVRHERAPNPYQKNITSRNHNYQLLLDDSSHPTLWSLLCRTLFLTFCSAEVFYSLKLILMYLDNIDLEQIFQREQELSSPNQKTRYNQGCRKFSFGEQGKLSKNVSHLIFEMLSRLWIIGLVGLSSMCMKLEPFSSCGFSKSALK